MLIVKYASNKKIPKLNCSLQFIIKIIRAINNNESDKNALKFQLTFMRNEIVMNIEKINMPPRPYKCNVRLPVLSMSGIDTSVIQTMMAPMPMVANLALSSVKPELVNRFVE